MFLERGEVFEVLLMLELHELWLDNKRDGGRTATLTVQGGGLGEDVIARTDELRVDKVQHAQQQEQQEQSQQQKLIYSIYCDTNNDNINFF